MDDQADRQGWQNGTFLSVRNRKSMVSSTASASREAELQPLNIPGAACSKGGLGGRRLGAMEGGLGIGLAESWHGARGNRQPRCVCCIRTL